ncbi:integrase, catalytic region, zinc finger, CCHC-type containing protein, partial [Tanacetum coccineum]
IGNVTISRVYYVEGLGHNLFSVGQFCDSDLEVAFCKHICFVRKVKGDDLLTGSRGNNLYTLSIGDIMKSSLICIFSKASKTKSWLWHRCLSHLNFGTINQLAKQVIMEYLVKISKRRAFRSLNEDILKITILKINTPYPSRKIRRIRACTQQRPQRKEDQYAVSNPLDTPYRTDFQTL